ncbi:hypothetical protein X975_24407, partial [Stegodyphus mimosarum]
MLCFQTKMVDLEGCRPYPNQGKRRKVEAESDITNVSQH